MDELADTLAAQRHQEIPVSGITVPRIEDEVDRTNIEHYITISTDTTGRWPTMEHSSVVVTISDPPCLDPVDGLATQHFKTQVDGLDARMECPLKLAQANVLPLETDRENDKSEGLVVSGKIMHLSRQWRDHAIQIVFVHEARTEGPEVRASRHFIAIMSSAADRTQNGTIIELPQRRPLRVAKRTTPTRRAPSSC